MLHKWTKLNPISHPLCSSGWKAAGFQELGRRWTSNWQGTKLPALKRFSLSLSNKYSSWFWLLSRVLNYLLLTFLFFFTSVFVALEGVLTSFSELNISVHLHPRSHRYWVPSPPPWWCLNGQGLWGSESGTLMTGLMSLEKKAQRRFLFHGHVRTEREDGPASQGGILMRTKSASTLSWASQLPALWYISVV